MINVWEIANDTIRSPVPAGFKKSGVGKVP